MLLMLRDIIQNYNSVPLFLRLRSAHPSKVLIETRYLPYTLETEPILAILRCSLPMLSPAFNMLNTWVLWIPCSPCLANRWNILGERMSISCEILDKADRDEWFLTQEPISGQISKPRWSRHQHDNHAVPTNCIVVQYLEFYSDGPLMK